jgi:Fe-S-cluster containining protein
MENPRDILNSKMHEINKSGKDCASCVGHCCTYQANSMQITPLETQDLYDYLQRKERINDKLIQSLKECVKEFRLDKEIFISKGKSLRRTYTCPFYKGESLGCSISIHSKPYGCLAFNPLEQKVSEFGKCSSDQALLEQVNFPKQLNQKIKESYQFDWEKKPIPLALLELLDKVKSL